MRPPTIVSTIASALTLAALGALSQGCAGKEEVTERLQKMAEIDTTMEYHYIPGSYDEWQAVDGADTATADTALIGPEWDSAEVITE